MTNGHDSGGGVAVRRQSKGDARKTTEVPTTRETAKLATPPRQKHRALGRRANGTAT